MMVPNPGFDCLDVFSGKAAISRAWFLPQYTNSYHIYTHCPKSNPAQVWSWIQGCKYRPRLSCYCHGFSWPSRIFVAHLQFLVRNQLTHYQELALLFDQLKRKIIISIVYRSYHHTVAYSWIRSLIGLSCWHHWVATHPVPQAHLVDHHGDASWFDRDFGLWLQQLGCASPGYIHEEFHQLQWQCVLAVGPVSQLYGE